MNKKKWIIVAVVAALLAGLGYAGYTVWQGFAARGAAAQSLAEEVAVVRRGTLRVTVNVNGSLAPHAEVSLAFASGGRVAEVLVVEGQRVEAGQALVRLETDDLTLQVTQAEISLRQAELQLENLLAPPDEADVARAQDGVDQAAAALRLAQISYDGTQNSVVVNEALEDAQSAYDQALEDYNYWLDEYNENDADYWYVDRAQERLDDAELALSRMQQQADQQLQSTSNELARAADTYRQAQNDLEALLAGPDESDIEAAQLQVDQSSAALEQARLRLEQATLTAPFVGTVTALNVQVGEMAGATQPAVVLSDLAALEVEINLDETDVAQVTVGQEAQVFLDAFPGVELTGEVTYIAPVAQVQSGVVLYPVTVSLTPTDLPVRGGMTADVDIVTVSQENALIVPLRAVQSVEGQTFVLRQVTGGQDSAGRGDRRQQLVAAGFEPVEVTLGIMTDTEVEITSGLEEGDVVSVIAAPSSDGQGAGGQMPGPGMFFGRGR